MSTLRHSPVAAAPGGRITTGGADVGLLVLRVVAGLVLAGHGVQKLFGVLGGPGLRGWEQEVRALGYEPAQWLALAHGVTELAGGALLALGLLTPLASAAMLGVMINAIAVKAATGFWAANGGVEYELVLATVGVAIAIAGPGVLSLDRRLRWARGGAVSAAVGIGVGAGAGIAALLLRIG